MMNILLDEEDLDLLSHNWTPLRSKHITYAKASIGGKQVLLHRAVADRLGFDKSLLVDHINGNALDNRRANLQPCTHQENIRKQRKSVVSQSRFKGVTPFRGGWRSRITIDRITKHIGVFASEVEAAMAYNYAAASAFEKFANLNTLSAEL